VKGQGFMADEAKHWWERHAPQFQETAQLPIDVVYGHHVNEKQLQLIGPVTGKHLLEIGCGGAQCGIAFAKQGAVVTGVDIAAAQLEYANELAQKKRRHNHFLSKRYDRLDPHWL
jgi:2-polyprenyl-3-methyl-5-hydroxy-6-metoxy-1,4-benzoquinol methylase